MASAVQNALKRKKELERELAEINGFIALHERFAAISDAKTSGRDRSSTHESDPETRESSAPDVSDKKRGRPAEFADAMEEILRETRRPLQRNDLVAELEQRGLIVPSDDKPRYVGTILWRQRARFYNVPGEGYTLPEFVTQEQRDAISATNSALGEHIKSSMFD